MEALARLSQKPSMLVYAIELAHLLSALELNSSADFVATPICKKVDERSTKKKMLTSSNSTGKLCMRIKSTKPLHGDSIFQCT